MDTLKKITTRIKWHWEWNDSKINYHAICVICFLWFFLFKFFIIMPVSVIRSFFPVFSFFFCFVFIRHTTKNLPSFLNYPPRRILELVRILFISPFYFFGRLNSFLNKKKTTVTHIIVHTNYSASCFHN